MNPTRFLKKLLQVALLVVVLWIAIGPIQLGGPVSFVIISGNSMEPEFQVGDLVLARKGASYQVGDKVVYNHPQIGHVFHRIVAGDGEGFVLQGDHNDWLDSFTPGTDQILGKFWLKIPGAGKLIRFLRQPAVFVIFILIGAIFVFSLTLIPGKDQPRSIKGKRKLMDQNTNHPGGTDLRQEALLALALVFLAGLVLGWIAWNRPLTLTIADDISYQHQSDFSYSAANDVGIYDRSGVETGDPIYPLVTCQVDLEYQYQLSTMSFLPGEEESLQGAFQLQASVSDADGWNRTFLLVPEYEFTGSTVQARSIINICRVLELIADKEQKTGTEIRWYTLAIEPGVKIAGSIRGLPFSDSYNPRIEFVLDETVLRLSEDMDQQQLDEDRILADTRVVPNNLLILGRQIQVRTARWVAGSILAACLLAAVYPAWSLIRAWGRSAISRIELENKPLLVDISKGSLERKGKSVVELASFQDLRKYAERCGALIMHEVSGDIHKYSVLDGDTIYQFSVDSQAGGGDSGSNEDDRTG